MRHVVHRTWVLNSEPRLHVFILLPKALNVIAMVELRWLGLEVLERDVEVTEAFLNSFEALHAGRLIEYQPLDL